MNRLLGLSSVALLVVVAGAMEREAAACGCFTAPNPAAQVVQAGEQLVFAVENGITTAHIRVQYQGKADEFGWLLPLPSVPTLELGSDELFTEISKRTRPDYLPKVSSDPGCVSAVSSPSSAGGCGGSDFASKSSIDCAPACPAGYTCSANGCVPDGSGAQDKVVVVSGNVGPYDYVVLHADDKSEMLTWLKNNRYFVPAAIDTAVTPYIHPGAYFLALKLRAGESTGSLLPVVVHYASDLPMIPLVLTSVGATPKMPIEVYVLGAHRAIPRNYHHVVVNEAAVDYATLVDYPTIAAAAVAEAPKHHGFITEYAGSTAPMKGVLDPASRFGDPAALEKISDAVTYVQALQQRGFLFGPELYGVLARYIPEPESLRGAVTEDGFYRYIGTWLPRAVELAGDGGIGDGGLSADLHYDPVALTDELWMRIVTPTLNAGRLFTDHGYLTRLFTALSPEDMTDDPVFDENPGLPEVPLGHGATLRFHCNTDSTVTLRDGEVIEYPFSRRPDITMPFARRIEVLPMIGAPLVAADNGAAIDAAVKASNEKVLADRAARDANANRTSGGSSGLQTSCALGRHRIARGELLLIAAIALLSVTLRRRRPRA